MHFISYFQCFEVCFQKSGFFFFPKKDVFPYFRLIQSVFRSIEISFKNLSESLSGSIDRNYFSINRILWIRFFKKRNLTFFKNTFSKVFQVFSLSLWFRLGSTLDFCHFLSFFLQGFSLQTPVRPFYPSFCFYFHISCIFMHFNLGILNLFLGFLMIQAEFCVIDQWVLLIYCYIHDLCWLIWSIWGFWDVFKILGLVLNPNWGFCSIWFNLMKLACWLDVIDHYFD